MIPWSFHASPPVWAYPIKQALSRNETKHRKRIIAELIAKPSWSRVEELRSQAVEKYRSRRVKQSKGRELKFDTTAFIPIPRSWEGNLALLLDLTS
jgi:hypothetical protein